jgi:HD-like signal output (HDOD) protein
MKMLIQKFWGTEKMDAVSIQHSGDASANDDINDAAILTNTMPIIVSDTKQPLTVLKKLAPIRDLNDYELQHIEQRTSSYLPESIVFTLGDQSDKIYYLLKGTIEFTLNGGGTYCISDSSTLANLPINSGKICGATAVTKSHCEILSIPVSVWHWWISESKTKANSATAITIDFSLPKDVPTTPFFNGFSQACRENRLSLPTLPSVAIQLRKAMTEDIGIAEAVKIIQLDVTVVTRLIQLSNSALYASLKPVTNCHNAVSRLGLNATCQLVMSISIKQLFQSKSPEFMLKMKYLWQKSVYVSSLSFVLAQESGVVNPEDALLAGLICDIGAIPLINFAEKNAEHAPSLSELQSAIPHLNANVGAFVLQRLDFSDELVEIPKHSENWYYESGHDALTLSDVVILAKFHSYLGTDRAKNLPYINSIPAYAKLKNGKVTPDFSLDIVAKAKQRISTAMGILA